MSKISHKSSPKVKIFRNLSAATLAAVIAALGAVSAVAAWVYLRPSEIAETLNVPALAQEFIINPTASVEEVKSTADYNFAFLGLVSGKDLTLLREDEKNMGSTYIVVAISKSDGTAFTNENYYHNPDAEQFFVSPIIKGVAPWQGGAVLSNGGAAVERIIDGVLYRIICCDNIEMFADKGLSLAVSTGTSYSNEAFDYNPQTGEITPKAGFESAVFDLNIDASKADPAAAAEYFDSLQQSDSTEEPRDSVGETQLDPMYGIDWSKATVVDGTQSLAEMNDKGEIVYSYDAEGFGKGRVVKPYNSCFPDNKPGSILAEYGIAEYADYNIYSATRFTLNEDGTVTGEIISIKL